MIPPTPPSGPADVPAADLILPPAGLFAAPVVAATTTRAFGAGAADRHDVAARLAARLAGAPAAWAGGRQCHGAAVAEVGADEPLPALFDATDALVTARRGVVLCSFTADCVPVVVADAEAGLTGIAHAGWRGTRAGIAGALVAELVARGGRRSRMAAWIGPAISGARYEVSEELAAEFAAAFPRHAAEVVRGRLLDLPRLNALQLADAGLEPARVVDSGVCTLSDAARCFSYRRDGGCGVHLVTGVALAGGARPADA